MGRTVHHQGVQMNVKVRTHAQACIYKDHLYVYNISALAFSLRIYHILVSPFVCVEYLALGDYEGAMVMLLTL